MRKKLRWGDFPRLVPTALLPVLLFPLLLWPAYVNGGPFFFPDTGAYVRGVDAAALRLTGHMTEWTSAKTLALAGRDTAAVKPVAIGSIDAAAAAQSIPVLHGRSVYYGALLYLGVIVGTLWLPVFAQALLAAAVIVAVMRHAIPERRPGDLAKASFAVTALLALTPLPFFVCMLMPDVLAGLGIIGAAMLLARWSYCSRAERTGWLILSIYAALCHSSIVLILMGMGASAAIIWLVTRRHRSTLHAGAAVLAAACAGLVGEAVFAFAVQQAVGLPPIRPPFLTARITADGVGTDYLNRRCRSERWTVCHYRSRLPLHSDSFLWSTNARDGVFMAASPAEQRALAAEQIDFAAAVLRNRPAALTGTLLSAAVEQARSAGLGEFNYHPDQSAGFNRHLPRTVLTEIKRTAAFQRVMPTAATERLVWPLTAVSLAVLAFAGWRGRHRSLTAVGGYAAVGWLVGIAVCGMLSTPHDRYQARVIWIFPLIAATVATAAAARRRSSADGDMRPIGVSPSPS